MAVSGRYKIRGATLIESLTALAIVCTVMGAAFTLYEKTASKQQQLMKTRARLVQAEIEQYLKNGQVIPDLSNDFITVNVETENYRQQSDVQHYTVTFSTKQGKMIMEKNYLKYNLSK